MKIWNRLTEEEKVRRFERQQRMEISAVEEGARAYLDKTQEGHDKGCNRMVTDILENIVPVIRKDRKKAKRLAASLKEGMRNNAPVFHTPLLKLSAEKLAMVTMFAVISSGKTGLLHEACFRIGNGVMAEIEFDVFRQEFPVEYSRMLRSMKNLNARKVLTFMNQFKERHRLNWSNAVRIKIGAYLAKVLVEEGGGWYEIHSYTENSWRKGCRRIRELRRTDIANEIIESVNGKAMLDNPYRRPMVCPPVPCSNAPNSSSGYLLIKTEMVNTPSRIRSNPKISQKTLDAVNVLQETEWTVNRQVLEVMEHVIDAGRSVGSNMPLPRTIPLPDRLSDKDWGALTKDERFLLKLERRLIHDTNYSNLSKRMALYRMVSVANMFRDEPVIWFPYHLDFRTRAYPSAVDLNPQGSELCKALLMFANPEPIGPSGIKWIAAALADHWGMDKSTLQEKLDWVMEMDTSIIKFAEDPINNNGWEEAENPWQFLAACFEWLELSKRDNPEDHLSHLPIHIDGACNGMQHLSAMMRDENAARLVNLLPGARQDLYQKTADTVMQGLLTSTGKSHKLLREHGVTRKMVKRAVMTIPYGLTAFGMREQLLNDRVLEGVSGKTPELAAALAEEIWKGMSKAMDGPMLAMKWFQEVAEKAADRPEPRLAWKTPNGDWVSQDYVKPPTKSIRTLLGCGRMRISPETDEVDKRKFEVHKSKMVSGIVPNLVHSFDASHMHQTVTMARQAGISSISTIHDSYGTHARHMDEMAKLTRLAFTRMYGYDWIQRLYENWVKDLDISEPPKRGGLNVNEVNFSDYFFS